ncbi:MAG: copper resistance protein CopC [Micropruina sp.]
MDGRCPWWRWASGSPPPPWPACWRLSWRRRRWPLARHATLVGTDPAAGSVRAHGPRAGQPALRRAEISLPANGVQFRRRRTRLPVTASTLDAVVTVELPTGLDGTYILAWRVVSTTATRSLAR